MNNVHNPWQKMLAEGNVDPDKESKEDRTARIMSDPRPQWREEPKKDYPVVEKHYIICVSEQLANASMPDQFLEYGEPHKVGGVLVSDRRDVPAGWIKMPPRGTSIEVVKKDYPQLYAVLAEKKIGAFR